MTDQQLRRSYDEHRMVIATRRLNLRACLAGYDAQYGTRSLGEQHPALPSGALDRIEAVVQSARQLEQTLAEHAPYVTFR